MPVTTLHTTEGFEGQPLNRCPAHPATPDGIVDTEGAVLISTKDKAGAELFVEIPDGKLQPLDRLTLGVKVRHTPSLEVRLESRKGMVEVFKPCPG